MADDPILDTMTTAEAMALLHVSERTLRRWLLEAGIGPLATGGHRTDQYRYGRESILALLAAHRPAAMTAPPVAGDRVDLAGGDPSIAPALTGDGTRAAQLADLLAARLADSLAADRTAIHELLTAQAEAIASLVRLAEAQRTLLAAQQAELAALRASLDRRPWWRRLFGR